LILIMALLPLSAFGERIGLRRVSATLTPQSLTTLFVAPLASSLSDGYPACLLGGTGMALALSDRLAIALLPAHSAHLDIAWLLSLGGVRFGLLMSPNARLIVG